MVGLYKPHKGNKNVLDNMLNDSRNNCRLDNNCGFGGNRYVCRGKYIMKTAVARSKAPWD